MRVLIVILLLMFPVSSSAVDGDLNCNGIANIADIVLLIQHVFNGLPLPVCSEYPDSVVVVNTTIDNVFYRMVEYLNEDTLLDKYHSAGPVIVHTFKTWEDGVLHDSSVYYDIVHRMWIYHVMADTFCCNLSGVILKADSTKIELWWTIPGIFGTVTEVTQYDLRYSQQYITESNWGSASQVFGEPNPSGTIAGSWQKMTVTGLMPQTTYYFGIKTKTDGIWSDLSNIVVRKTTGFYVSRGSGVSDLR